MTLSHTGRRGSITLLAVATLVGSASAQPYNRMLVFGDSLSDTGTTHHYTTQANSGSLGLVGVRPVGPTYALGRWTNGATVNYPALNLANSGYAGIWHWKLGDALGIPRAQNYHTGVPNNNNFAAGGATTAAGQQSSWGYTTSDNIGHQVNNFFLGSNPTMSNQTLYAMMGGGNDIRDAVRSGVANDVPTSTAVGRTAAQNMGAYINALATRAANQNVHINVAWANVVPMQHIPDFADAYGGNLSWRLSAGTASTAFRDEWSTQIANLRAAHPASLSIYPINYWQYFTDMRAGLIPGTGGLNQTDPILNFNGFSDIGFNPQRNALGVVPAGANPDNYVFWDLVHPTARVHDLMGSFAASAIPAPGSIALLAAAAGIVARRRRHAA